MALIQFEVCGGVPIRDAVTKESVQPGGTVTLDDAEVPRKKGKPLAPTLISALLEAGVIRPVKAEKPKAEKA